jgi:hypothetical protein
VVLRGGGGGEHQNQNWTCEPISEAAAAYHCISSPEGILFEGR